MKARSTPRALRRTRGFLADAYNRAFRYADWNVGIVQKPIHVFLRSEATPEIRWLPPPRFGRYRADPFGIVRDGTVYVLCEEFDYRSRKGVVSCIELPEDAPPLQPRVVLDLSTHVSYPYTFQDREEVYCVPETAQAWEVGIYRAQEFPDRWEKVGTLLEGAPFLDNTLFHYGGRWWLTSFRREGPSPGLHVWYAPDPLGPWEPHDRNPVKTSPRSSRPGGTPFVFEGSLYRPAQDFSRFYGRRIVINRVIRLSAGEFEEEEVAVIEPYARGPYPDGLHTLSSAGDTTLVDGQRLVFVRSAITHSAKDPLFARWIERLVEDWWPRTRSSLRR